jgi:hypothetical protein
VPFVFVPFVLVPFVFVPVPVPVPVVSVVIPLFMSEVPVSVLSVVVVSVSVIVSSVVSLLRDESLHESAVAKITDRQVIFKNVVFMVVNLKFDVNLKHPAHQKFIGLKPNLHGLNYTLVKKRRSKFLKCCTANRPKKKWPLAT